MDKTTLRTKLWEIGEPTSYSREEYVYRLYNILLRRDPDEDGLNQYMKMADLKDAFYEIIQSEEFKKCASSNMYLPGQPDVGARILLFGAYGNGNLGDSIQAASLARLINRVLPTAEIWASSESAGAYPFHFHRVLPHNAVQDPNVVNQFDMLFIGGGGLFSHPHPPLNDPNWQKSLTVPVVIFGVGADRSIVKESRHLIEKAVYVSGRDAASIEALRDLVNDVRFVTDPVLGDPAFLSSHIRGIDLPKHPTRKLWILKQTGAINNLAIKQEINASTDTVCFLEPNSDYGLLINFPNSRAIYSCELLVDYIDKSDLVISTRYHGCILSMLRGKPVIGVHELKCRQLLERFGNNSYFTPDFESFTWPRLETYQDVSALMRKDQRALSEQLGFILKPFAQMVARETTR